MCCEDDKGESEMKKILIDAHGMQIKLPKTTSDLKDLIVDVVNETRRETMEQMQNVIHGKTNINPRQDIISALAQLGQANAKIAYSLMKALEVGECRNFNPKNGEL